MNKKIYFKLFIGVIIFAMTSCIPHERPVVHWLLYVQSQDTLLLNYPVTVFDSDGLAIPSNKEIKFQTMIVKSDTFEMGVNTTFNGLDFSNIELHLARFTHHDDVRVLFIRERLFPLNILNNDFSVNYSPLDSMMNIYGVTLPADQDQISVRLTTNEK